MFPNFLEKKAHFSLTAFTLCRSIEVARDEVCAVVLGNPQSWTKSCFATLRLFAAVMLRCAETSASAGALLRRPFELQLGQEVLQAEGVMLRRPQVLFTPSRTPSFPPTLVAEDELVRTLQPLAVPPLEPRSQRKNRGDIS